MSQELWVELGKSREMDSPLEHPKTNTAYYHLDFSPER